MDENKVVMLPPPRVKPPTWAKTLNEKQLIGAELMARGCFTQKEIAEQLGIADQTISRRWKHNPIFMKYVDYLATQNTLNAALRIKGLTLEAIDVYSELLRSNNSHIKARVAKDILDRAGIKDLKFDLLPKEDKVDKDSEEIKRRLLALLDSENAGSAVKDLSTYMQQGKPVEIIDAEFVKEDGTVDEEDLAEEYEQDED